MNRHRRSLAILVLAVLAACAVGHRVSYQQEIYPILADNCFTCHTPPDGEGYRTVGLNMASWQTLMRGSDYGRIIVPGDSRRSVLNMLVEGRADASLRMPHDAVEPLSDGDIESLRRWVDQGAKNN